MEKKQNIFLSSLRELKSTRNLATIAIFIAINIALDLMGLTVRIGPSMRLGFGFLCNASVGMLFGPTVGIMTGFCTDVLGFFAGNAAQGAFNPLFTLVAMTGGLIYGLWLYPSKVSVWRAAGAKFSINLICNVLMNTYFLALTQGKGMIAMLPARIFKNIVLLPIEVVLLFFVLTLVKKTYKGSNGLSANKAQKE